PPAGSVNPPTTAISNMAASDRQGQSFMDGRSLDIMKRKWFWERSRQLRKGRKGRRRLLCYAYKFQEDDTVAVETPGGKSIRMAFCLQDGERRRRQPRRECFVYTAGEKWSPGASSQSVPSKRILKAMDQTDCCWTRQTAAGPDRLLLKAKLLP
ncbi:hypothetical protein STEG23_036329, partial [Scotinomys teguina]